MPFWAALASGLLKVGKALGKYGLEQSGFDTSEFFKPRQNQEQLATRAPAQFSQVTPDYISASAAMPPASSPLEKQKTRKLSVLSDVGREWFL